MASFFLVAGLICRQQITLGYKICPLVICWFCQTNKREKNASPKHSVCGSNRVSSNIRMTGSEVDHWPDAVRSMYHAPPNSFSIRLPAESALAAPQWNDEKPKIWHWLIDIARGVNVWRMSARPFHTLIRVKLVRRNWITSPFLFSVDCQWQIIFHYAGAEKEKNIFEQILFSTVMHTTLLCLQMQWKEEPLTTEA